MERIKETVERCIRALQKAPINISDRLFKLFHELSEFLKEHPEDAKKALPILLRLHRCIIEGDYAQALEQLFLLVVLIRLCRRKQ